MDIIIILLAMYERPAPAPITCSYNHRCVSNQLRTRVEIHLPLLRVQSFPSFRHFVINNVEPTMAL